SGNADGAGQEARFNFPSGLGADTVGNVYMADTIRKGYPPPQILNSGFVGGQFRFDLTAPPGQSVLVEACFDLMIWFPLGTNIFNFSDPQTGLYSNRFYRSVVIAL